MKIPKPTKRDILFLFTGALVVLLVLVLSGVLTVQSPVKVAQAKGLAVYSSPIGPPKPAPAAPEPPRTPPAPVRQPVAVSAPIRANVGSPGYIMAGNNCVACVRAMTGRSQNGNAGTWRASSSVPWVGAIMIFRAGEQGASYAGHVGVVTAINGNRISLKHCNFPGRTEFYSTGKFF